MAEVFSNMESEQSAHAHHNVHVAREIEIEKNKYKAEILSKPLNQKNYKNS